MDIQQLLTPFDLTKFRWQKAKDSTKTHTRPLAGTEIVLDFWSRRCKGDLNLFVGVYLDLLTPATIPQIIDSAQQAWIWLRYQVPTIAAQLHTDSHDAPHLVYKPAEHESLSCWLDNTLLIEKQDTLDLDTLRRQLGPAQIPFPDGNLMHLHLVIPSGEHEDPVSRLGVLLHCHHLLIDGLGALTLLNQYFTKLADIVGSDYTKESFAWGTEVDKLLPAVFNVMDASELRPVQPGSFERPSFALPYYASLASALQDTIQMFEKPLGFKPRNPDSGLPSTSRMEVEFTRQDSEKLVKSLKASGYTVTHLAHAALSLVARSDSVSDVEDASLSFINFSIVNCRHRLTAPYCHRGKYPGNALGIHLLKVPLSLFISDSGEFFPIDKSLVAKLLDALRDCYETQKVTPGLLSRTAQGSEIVAATLKYSFMNNRAPVNQCYSFSSDGVGENYLDATFSNGSGTPIVGVTKYFTSLNRVDPAPYFRISSWKGIIYLSADFNENIITAKEVSEYMVKWKEYMLLGI
ncbi:hypothetical protein GYMLUDRAFT_86133 [Collybiopsis luxurians FD-317 M1]|uniref:Condensation domain-containing protein n=1 Tax=Collybiopsis luxurians FD-317 M1 TaxID=944289 RepID=A0A0D0C877_9AGAR|nr:hypothetical protein GYMLUDRAFT_86133 [Collybiopsis luxurians FD-317 M1]